MARFVYKMQSILNIKQKTEGQIKMEFAAAQAELNRQYDILDEYINDKCVSLIDSLTYTKGDKIDGNEPKTDIVILGDYLTGLSSLKQALVEFVSYLDEIGYTAPVNNKKKRSYFRGSFADFKRYVGPKCRNAVNIFCKSERESHHGICEYCGQKAELQSAHITDRPIIMHNILEATYKVDDDYYDVDLDAFFDLFKKEHMPIRDKIFFLCKDCHDNLDKYNKITVQDIKNKRGY